MNVCVYATPITQARQSETQGDLSSSSLSNNIRVSAATGLEIE